MRLPFDIETQRRQPEEREIRGEVMRSQTRDAWDSPYQSTFDHWQPFTHNFDLYKAIRESIPIIDMAIVRYQGLIGTFEIDAFGNTAVQELLDNFCNKVRVNSFERGVNQWVNQMVDSTLETGAGYGEIIPFKSLADIYKLKNARTKDFRFIKENDELVFGIMDKNNFQPVKIENQDYIYMLTFDTRQGHPQGYSLIHSLPFVSNIFQRIQKTIDNQLWRMGDPTFIVIVEAGENSQYKEVSESASGLQSQFKSVMRERRMGKVGDIFGATPAGANAVIKVLGEGIEIPDLTVPVRTILEQIIAKTGFPPFIFGINWSTTERLSTHQNDMIISTIKSYRSQLDPIIEKVLDMFLIMQGHAGAKYKWEWKDVNLMDEVELAKARHLNATALIKEMESRLIVFDIGILQLDELTDWLIEAGITDRKKLKMYGEDAIISNLRKRIEFQRACRTFSQFTGNDGYHGNGFDRKYFSESVVEKLEHGFNG